jgi:hypothetical protein
MFPIAGMLLEREEEDVAVAHPAAESKPTATESETTEVTVE